MTAPQSTAQRGIVYHLTYEPSVEVNDFELKLVRTFVQTLPTFFSQESFLQLISSFGIQYVCEDEVSDDELVIHLFTRSEGGQRVTVDEDGNFYEACHMYVNPQTLKWRLSHISSDWNAEGIFTSENTDPSVFAAASNVKSHFNTLNIE